MVDRWWPAKAAAGHDLGLLNPALYAIGDEPGSGLQDVTAGNTTVSGTNSGGQFDGPFTVPGYNAVPAMTWPPAWQPRWGKLVSQLAHGGRGWGGQ